MFLVLILLPVLSVCILVSIYRALFASIYRAVRTMFCVTSPLPETFGDWAVITGASDGIGEAIARELAMKGMDLFLLGRSAEKLLQTVQKIEKVAPNVKITTSVFDFSSVNWDSKSFKALDASLKNLDIGVLINCMGISYPSALMFDEVDELLIDDLISVNVRATLQLTRSVLPGMRKRKRGAILCMGSGVSQLPTEPLYAGYVATKAAIDGFCRSLQVECVKDNIVVQCQTPLLVATKMSRIKHPSLTVPSAATFGKEAVNCLMSATPTMWLPAVASPNLIHSVILFVAQLSPLILWNTVRLRMSADMRRRYQAKQKTK